MLDHSQAMLSVKFVDEALRDPPSALNREDMGALHTALAPYLRDWATSTEDSDRDVLMVSAVGSINYGTVIPSSDLDMKAVYLPDLRDFYHGKFPKFSFVTDQFDCELHPAHHFCQHVLKGNINFFEPLYAKACLTRPWFAHIMLSILKPLVEMNVKMTALASYFTAEQQNKGIGYAKGDETWGNKKASHAIRILAFLINLLDRGTFDLVTAEPFRNAVCRLKRNEMQFFEYQQLYDELHDVAKGMMFTHFENGGNFTWTDRVEELDGKDTPQWNELRATLDDELLKLIREPIEATARRNVGYPRR